MGSHHSHEHKEGGGSGFSTPRAGSRRGTTPRGSNAGTELDKQERPPPTSLVPIEKLGKSPLLKRQVSRQQSLRSEERWLPRVENLHLTVFGIQVNRIKKKELKKTAAPTCKLLAQRSQKEDGVNGITEKSFSKYVFPLYPELARRFYRYVHRSAKCKNQHIPLSSFRAHCERILAMLDDGDIIDTYVRMFGCEEDESTVRPEGFHSLLHTSYKLSMDHYPEGPQTCMQVQHTLAAVVNGCFNKKDSHSVGFVVRWLMEHCHRLIFPIHRYCVHMLATRHRAVEAAAAAAGGGAGGGAADGAGAGLELATPVLERSPWAAAGTLLPVSVAWLLAGAAPPLYSRPGQPPPLHSGAGGLASRAWLARLVCAVPVHWTPLYDARDHGLGANRFLHHTLAYRGPTIVLLQAQQLVVAICAPQEWRETHQYWGGPECAIIQLQPTFAVVETGPKLLYLNLSIRGYPQGLRAGADPRRPLLTVPQDFDTITFLSVPYNLTTIEVWGCGDQTSRETQLEIKKWQVREAERQRQVKLSPADWMEHPDRYLLELAGRPQYNNSGS